MVYIVRQYPTGFQHLAKETVYDSFEQAKKYAFELEQHKGVDISIKIYEADNSTTLKRKLLCQW